MSDEPDADDAQFASMMEQEAARPDLAPPPPEDDPLTPGDMLAATVESGKAAAAEKPAEPAPAAPVQFTAEEFLAQRERLQRAERERDDARKPAEKPPEKPRPGLFESPEEWEAELERRVEERAQAGEQRLRQQALDWDLAQTRIRVGDEKANAMGKAVAEAAERDPQFAAQLAALSPYGAGAAIEKWYDSTEAVRDPAAYERRLREKFLADPEFASEFMARQNASNAAPAGQKPATSATAAGENVVKLPPSLSRQAASRAATSGDDGDDSEAAIFAAGANPRRQA
jgi:hypothetical protein